MTIRINQTAVDFTLESETTLAELAESLGRWALGQGLVLVGVLADGRAQRPGETVLLQGVSIVDVEVVPQSQQEVTRLGVVGDYFSLVTHAVLAKDEQLLQDLRSEFPSVREAVEQGLTPFLTRALDALSALEGPWSPSPTVADAAGHLGGLVEARLFELTQPDRALAQTVMALESSLPSLEDLAVLFQRGQDKQGFDRILDLFTRFDDAGRRAELSLASHPGEAEGWRQWHQELAPFLAETRQALESGDFILLTDLLEYEVTPRLKALRDVFPWISVLDPVPDLL